MLNDDIRVGNGYEVGFSPIAIVEQYQSPNSSIHRTTSFAVWVEDRNAADWRIRRRRMTNLQIFNKILSLFKVCFEKNTR